MLSQHDKKQDNINFFNFKKFDDKYLITNDTGRFLFLTDSEFKSLTNGNYYKNEELTKKLIQNYFVFENNREIFIEEVSSEVRKNKSYLFEATQLHIFVLTIKCNQQCLYCQASVKNKNYKNGIMDFNTAEKAVDIAFQSPSRNLTFEFQGGEPLLNFEVLKHIVEYTKQKNQTKNKNINFSLVSNLTLVNDEIIDFLIDNKFNICTSIDGPNKIHNINRPLMGSNSLDLIKRCIKKINNRIKQDNINMGKVQAIQTTTKHSLRHAKEIIDEYVNIGINNVFIRALTPLGYAKRNWDSIGYDTEEFLEFYRQCLDYLIQLSLKGNSVSEVYITIFLKKILKHQSLNYMELRSPCGGSLGQLAYNYNGNVYTCDEGRMIAESGDHSFKLGNVNTNIYKDLVENPVTKTVCISSCLESIPGCSDCVYYPYCGVCPIYNYVDQKSIFGQMPTNYKCKINKGILDIIFNYIKSNNEQTLQIFKKWADC